MGKKVILCVDDEKIILDILKRVLFKEFGNEFDIETAESAEEALEVLEDLNTEGDEVSIIISDWLMPGMKGDEFLIHVHRNQPSILKIILTGQASEDAIQNARANADLFAYIQKPWDKQYLISTLYKALETL